MTWWIWWSLKPKLKEPQLKCMNDNYEVEVCYLDKLTGAYKHRKTVLYGNHKTANSIFNGAVKKMQDETRTTLITVRENRDEQWTLLRSEKT